MTADPPFDADRDAGLGGSGEGVGRAGPAPLADLRVVDLSQNLAGPYATQLLADLGADVVKVEPPGGDPARDWGPPFVDGESPLFLCANRNKRGVVLDLKTQAGREALSRLLPTADVFVQAFRHGVAARLGCDEASVRRRREDVIYVSVTAFGEEGPLKERPGYDPMMQAYAGLMSVTGHPGGPPARAGSSVVDFGTGLWTAVAILGALRERDRTGEGSHVSTSLLDTSLALMAYHLQGYRATGEVPGPMGSGIAMIAPYEAFPTLDGSLLIAAGNDATFARLCRALALEGVAADPRFRTNADRVENRRALVETVAGRTAGASLHELSARLREADVPHAPVRNVEEVADDPQVAASGMLRHAGDPTRPAFVDVAPPPRLDGERPPVRRPPPRLGQHTEEVLRELGLA